MQRLMENNAFLTRKGKPVVLDVNPARKYASQDWLVYLVAGVILLLGIIRSSYLKYFNDMFRAFFNPTLSQRQLKDQLSQSPFPNFLLNLFLLSVWACICISSCTAWITQQMPLPGCSYPGWYCWWGSYTW